MEKSEENGKEKRVTAEKTGSEGKTAAEETESGGKTAAEEPGRGEKTAAEEPGSGGETAAEEPKKEEQTVSGELRSEGDPEAEVSAIMEDALERNRRKPVFTRKKILATAGIVLGAIVLIGALLIFLKLMADSEEAQVASGTDPDIGVLVLVDPEETGEEKSDADMETTEEATTGEPVTEETTTEEPTTEMATEAITTEEPTTEEPSTEEPTEESSTEAETEVQTTEEPTTVTAEAKVSYAELSFNSVDELKALIADGSLDDYQLPIIYITTDDGSDITSTEVYKSGSFSIFYKGEEVYADIEEASMNIRGRGHSSWKLDKKPYKIKFTQKTSLFGLTAAKEWCLIANHADYSLIRNTLAMEMASELENLVFVPTSHMVDVFVNGTYVGVYSICEQVEMKDGRVPGDRNSTDIDTDYLLEISGDGKDTSFGQNAFASLLYSYITIEGPDEEVLSYEQYEFIRKYMNATDDAVMNGGYEEYIDVASLIDYFILLEFSYNTDGAFRRSNFLYKQAGGLLYMAAPWDYDYGFGNFSLNTDTYDDWISLGNSKTDNYDEYIKDNWMTYLLEDASFCAQLKVRWNEIGETLYQKALTTIDELEVTVAPSAAENFTVWNVLGTRIQYQSRQSAAVSTWEGQIQYLRDYIETRYKWMNKTINAM